MIGDAIMLHSCVKFGPDMGETCTAPHTEYSSVIHHVVMNLPPLTICLPQHLMTKVGPKYEAMWSPSHCVGDVSSGKNFEENIYPIRDREKTGIDQSETGIFWPRCPQ